MKNILISILLLFGFQCFGFPWSSIFKTFRPKVKNPKVLNKPKLKPNVEETSLTESELKPKTTKLLIEEPAKELPEIIIDSIDKHSKEDTNSNKK